MRSLSQSFSRLEKTATVSLAAIFAARMLGLFMIIPVFSLYARHLSGATPFLIGVAMGCYGLTQALLQIPFGMCSDRWGRKPVIALGLLLFAAGSVVAALSHSIVGIILGRALQGAGAIGSTIIAFLADVTDEKNRTKAMAIIGVTIGSAFSLGMVLGPLLNTLITVNGIFWLTAMMALGGLWILYYLPAPKTLMVSTNAKTLLADFAAILRNGSLLRLNFSILLSHAILTASFIVLPISIHLNVGLLEKQQWLLYLSVLSLAFLCMPLLIIVGERKYPKAIFLLSIISIGIAELGLWFWQHSLMGTAVALWLFFTAFTLLEAILPAKVSKTAPAHRKGTAIGVYSSCQFLGIFLGGCLGGWIYGHFSTGAVLITCAALVLLWLSLILPYSIASFKGKLSEP